jgi:mono/diheme cytochrome c family protein
LKVKRFKIAVATVVAFAAIGALHSSPRAQKTLSVWDGVYTDEQATRGEKIYSRECASCHGDDMTGVDEATALAGPAFLANWDGLTVGDLSERTRRSMPPSKPGRLSRREIADILCYVLRVNSFPAGKTELESKTELLKQIRIEATKPKANSE